MAVSLLSGIGDMTGHVVIDDPTDVGSCAATGVRDITRGPVGASVMERVMGIEPTSKAWEAFVLPLNYTRTYLRIKPILQSRGDQSHPTVVEE